MKQKIRALLSPISSQRPPFLSVILLTIALYFPFSLPAALQPGDLAIIAMDIGSTDQFSVLAIRDIAPGEVIHFTDAGWNVGTNAFAFGESHHSWTAPMNGIPKGTAYSLTYPGSFANSGDQLLVYQGSMANPTFITAINNSGNGGWQSSAYNFAASALPPGLIEGLTAVAVPEGLSIRYNCAQRQGNHVELLNSINNPDNWLRSNISDFPAANCNFTIYTPGQNTMALYMDKVVAENAGSITVRVVSDRIGNHEATISYAGGTASSGQDFSYNNAIRATFTNSQVFTANIPLIDDNDCESWESVRFSLINPTGGAASYQQATVLIEDDESPTPIFYQGFETSPADNWPYTTSPAPYNFESAGNGDIIYGSKSVFDPVKDFNATFNAIVGQYMYGMAFYTTTQEHVIDFAPLDVSGLDGGELSFLYTTFNASPASSVQYAVAYDNGNQWSSYVSLDRNNQAWERVVHNIPSNVSYVRFRFRTKQVNGSLCAGLDDVRLVMRGCITPPEVAVSAVASPICLNGPYNFSAPYTATGSFTAGNTFIVELSDAAGNFANPTVIGSQTAYGTNFTGTVACTIPTNTAPGNGYRIRIRSTQPALTSQPNGQPITINLLSLTLSSPTFASGNHISCPGANDGSIDLTIAQGSAPYTFNWTGPGGFTATSEDLSSLAPGTYQVSVSDANGCTSSNSITLTEPMLNIGLAAQDITCAGAQNGQITLTINGSSNPFQVAWTGPGGFTSTATNLSGLGAGTYTVTVTDLNGCVRTASASITAPALLSGNLASPNGPCGHQISCANGTDGAIDLTVNGGTAPYIYTWNGPGGYTASTQDLNGLGAGSYAVTVTDARGCTLVKNTSLSEPAPLASVLATPTLNCGYHVSCYGAADGSARLDTVTGGCPPYTLAWSNGQTGTTASNLAAGTHSVTITDAAGCTQVETVSLTQPDSLALTANIQPATCPTAMNGAIDLSVAGGCPPYAFSWTGDGGFTATSEDLASLFPGNYALTVVDANGCTTSFADSVPIVNDLSATLGCCQDTFICEGQSLNLTVDFTGAGPWLLTYSDGQQNYTVNVPSSPYILTVTPDSTTTYSLVSMTQDYTDCPGEVCGSATVAVNACDSSDCDDLCVNTGVLSHFDNGNCRTVTLELACDTLCNSKTSIKSGGVCMGTRTFRFDADPNGNPLPAGTVASNQWAALGITVTVTNNNAAHPQKGVLFDSSNPTGGDVDLGTPHQDFGGPGVGTGGAQGAPGQNDTPMGKLLVIAENDVDSNNDGLIDDPDDEAGGGEMRLDFAIPFYVESLTMVDLDNGNGFIRVVHHGGQTTDFNIPGLGDNAVTAVPITLDSVTSVRVVLPGSGGIAALAYCPQDSAAEFVDISIPCGNLSSFNNSLNLPMELVVRDPATGITGLRVHGLPAYCLDSTGHGPFTVTYEVCDALCAGDFCLPLIAYSRNGCVQYETAVSGSVRGLPPVANRKTISGNGLVEVFPNPVQGMANFRMTTMYDCTGSLDLYDLSGVRQAQIWQGDLRAEQERQIRFDRGRLPAGVYFLRLRTSHDEGFVRKFLIID